MVKICQDHFQANLSIFHFLFFGHVELPPQVTQHGILFLIYPKLVKMQGSHHTWKTWKNRARPGKPGKTGGFGTKTWKNIAKPGKKF